jgi:hypothetical protein
MRLNKTSRRKTSSHANTSTLAKRVTRITNSMPFKWDDGSTTIFLVATGVAVALMLSAAMGSRKSADTTAANTPPANVRAQVQAAKAPGAATSNAMPARTASKVSAPDSPVTITGCLEQDDETFRLKNTTGADAPKARSWKSGFLKKNSASIEVVGAADRVKLTDHVGERVVVTGMLVDREMQVRSLRRVSASCNQKA